MVNIYKSKFYQSDNQIELKFMKRPFRTIMLNNALLNMLDCRKMFSKNRNHTSKVYSGACQTIMMEFFMKIFTSQMLFTVLFLYVCLIIFFKLTDKSISTNKLKKLLKIKVWKHRQQINDTNTILMPYLLTFNIIYYQKILTSSTISIFVSTSLSTEFANMSLGIILIANCYENTVSYMCMLPITLNNLNNNFCFFSATI